MQPEAHTVRAYYAGNNSSTPHYMPFYAPTADGVTLYHRVITTIKKIRETNQIAAVDRDKRPFTVDLATPLLNDYPVSTAPYPPWFVEIDSLDPVPHRIAKA